MRMKIFLVAFLACWSLLAPGVSADQDPNMAKYEFNGEGELQENSSGDNYVLQKRGGELKHPGFCKNHDEFHDLLYAFQKNKPDKYDAMFPEGEYYSAKWLNGDGKTLNDQAKAYMKGKSYDDASDLENFAGDMPLKNNNFIWFRIPSGAKDPRDADKFAPIDSGFPKKFNEIDPYVWSPYAHEFFSVDRTSVSQLEMISVGELKKAGATFDDSKVSDEVQLPLNPKGGTGDVNDKKYDGTLFRHGVNKAVDPIVMRRKGVIAQDGKFSYLEENDNKIEFEVIMVYRDDGTIAIPGGMVDPGDTMSRTLQKELGEEAVKGGQETIDAFLNIFGKHMIYKGFSDDVRNYDHSFVETECVSHMDMSKNNEQSLKMKTRAVDTEAGGVKGAHWMTLTYDTKTEAVTKEAKADYFASHGYLLEKAVKTAMECFELKDDHMEKKDTPDCAKAEAAYKKFHDKSINDAKKNNPKSLKATCCLWLSEDKWCTDFQTELTEDAREDFKSKYIMQNSQEKWEEAQQKKREKCEGKEPSSSPEQSSPNQSTPEQSTPNQSTTSEQSTPKQATTDSSSAFALQGNWFVLLVGVVVLALIA